MEHRNIFSAFFAHTHPGVQNVLQALKKIASKGQWNTETIRDVQNASVEDIVKTCGSVGEYAHFANWSAKRKNAVFAVLLGETSNT